MNFRRPQADRSETFASRGNGIDRAGASGLRKSVAHVAAGLADIRAYVIAHHIATVPSDVLPMVRETPPYARATTFASMDSPGPFEKTSEAFYYVTLPDPSWPDAKKEQLLESYSAPTISNVSVHEVFPGHYVQFLNNRLNHDLLRLVYGSGANIEGWALYCEQMMLDEGLHEGDPKYRLAQLQDGADARVPIPGRDQNA